MNTKLTLTIENAVIDSAKKYARTKGRSLSAIVENYLKSLGSQGVDAAPRLSPKVANLLGSVKLPEDFDYKQQLTEGLMKKYNK